MLISYQVQKSFNLSDEQIKGITIKKLNDLVSVKCKKHIESDLNYIDEYSFYILKDKLYVSVDYCYHRDEWNRHSRHDLPKSIRNLLGTIEEITND